MTLMAMMMPPHIIILPMQRAYARVSSLLNNGLSLYQKSDLVKKRPSLGKESDRESVRSTTKPHQHAIIIISLC